MIIPKNIVPGESIKETGIASMYDEFSEIIEKTNYTLNVECKGKEPITTPAGDFDGCLVFNYLITTENDKGDIFMLTDTKWFAPELGMVRRIWALSASEKNSALITTNEEKLVLKSAIINGEKIGKDRP